jgi:hypothetical protein
MTKLIQQVTYWELNTPEKNVGVIQLFFINEAGYSLLIITNSFINEIYLHRFE